MIHPGPGSSDAVRKWVHIAAGTGALLLGILPVWQVAILAAAFVAVNAALLRALTRGRLHRPHELATNLPPGLVLYPVSVLLVLLLFPSRPDIGAAAWGILAAGDGASTLVGRRFGRRRWPWNRRKSVEGSLALLVAGGAAGAFLAWWCRPAMASPPSLWFTLVAPPAAALVAAAAETAAIRFDDNLTVPLTAAGALWALSLVRAEPALDLARALPAALLVAVPANAAAAWAGYAAGGVSRSGAIAGAIIGTVVHVGAGWSGWALLLTAFACAAGTSRLGLDRKRLLGIAEAREGRRGAGNAIANTGISAVAAAVSALSYNRAAALIAFTAALTAAASDTMASEIGKAWGRRTWAILPPRPVAPGTSGAVSLEGTAAGLVGAGALAALAVSLGLAPASSFTAIVGAAAAGSLVESLLGATLERPGLLNNDALNLINTVVAVFAALALTGGGV